MSTKTSSTNNNSSSGNTFLGAGILAAIAASLCCITPVLALLGGISGVAATFSWLQPARPFLIGTTLLVLGFTWYQKLKPKKVEEINCACEEDEKPSFLQSKSFLGIVTALALLLLAFPYYSGVFFVEKSSAMVSIPASQIAQAKLHIQGMTCSGCEQSVNHALQQKDGVIKASSSYQEGTALVAFDPSKVSLEELSSSVAKATGYKVTKQELVNNN